VEIGAHVVLFNVRMRQRRKELGLTQKDLAELSGVNVATISKIEILQPLRATISTKKYLNSIAVALDCDFDFLFPPEYIDAMAEGILPGRRNLIFVKDISFEQLPITEPDFLLPAPEEIALDNIIHESLLGEVEDLPDREKDYLKKHFGIGCEVLLLEEIAALDNISRERVRQIIKNALWRLGMPHRRKKYG